MSKGESYSLYMRTLGCKSLEGGTVTICDEVVPLYRDINYNLCCVFRKEFCYLHNDNDVTMYRTGSSSANWTDIVLPEGYSLSDTPNNFSYVKAMTLLEATRKRLGVGQ